MVDKFWNFFSWERGSMARARSDAPSRADRPPRAAAALALEAARRPCAVRSRASRASEARGRGGMSSVCMVLLRDAVPVMCWH